MQHMPRILWDCQLTERGGEYYGRDNAHCQMSAAQAAETVVPVYGAPAYVDGSPIGGGTGYSQIYSAADADYVVTTAAELKSALASASSGQIVYIADGATITLNSDAYMWGSPSWHGMAVFFYVKAGVILAAGRGLAASPGNIVLGPSFHTTGWYTAVALETGARMTGVTVAGAMSNSSETYVWSGVTCHDNTEVDNCEIYGMGGGQAVIATCGNYKGAWVHHCYLHNCQCQSQSGYGVLVNGGLSLIEGNKFEYCKHFIAAAAGLCSWTFRYNYLGPKANYGGQIDQHGGNDSSSASIPAGNTIEIYNNTSINQGIWFVEIRGIPNTMCSVHNNWTYLPSTFLDYGGSGWGNAGPIGEIMTSVSGKGYNAPNEGAFVRMTVYDNWYGTTPPLSMNATNDAPVTPAAPEGTVSGQAGTSYTYSVKTTDPDGDSIAYTIDWGDGTSSTTGQMESGVTGSASHTWTQSGTYAVRVKATDSKGNVSAWSPSLSVVIAGAVTVDTVASPVPTLLSPANGAHTNDSTPFLDWRTVTDTTAVHYQLQVDNNADFSSPAISETWITPSQYTVTSALSNGVYYWRVRAVDVAGNVSAWTASRSFAVRRHR